MTVNPIESTTWPSSLWRDTAISLPASPPLSDSVECDVVIVGGGYTGLSAALHLAQAGQQVRLLERVAPGWGCSGRNGGQVNPAWKVLPEELDRRIGSTAADNALGIANDATDLVFQLVERFDLQCDAIRPGYVQGNYSRTGQRRLNEWVRQWRARGVDVELLDSGAISDLLGTSFYKSGMIDARGGSVQPMSYARGLAKAAINAGAQLHDESPVLRVEKSTGDWCCHTPQGSVTARTLLWCTNGYTDKTWPRLRESIVPVSSFLVASDPLTEQQRASVLPGRHAVSETANVQTYYRIDAQGRFVMGGRGNVTNLELDDNTRWLEQRAVAMFPLLDNVHWAHRWGGHVAMTPEWLPRLMQLDNNAYAGMGYNGRGVAMATMMGKQLAQQVVEGSTQLPLQPLKPILFHRFRQLGITARIAGGLMRDRLSLQN